MKKSIKKFAYIAVASLAFFACGNTEDDLISSTLVLNADLSSSFEKSSSSEKNIENFPAGAPAMHNKVIAYLRVGDEYSGAKFIDDTDLLKSWFPCMNVLQDEKCNYFAAIFPIENNGMGYMVLSQDMTLYSIQPDSTGKKKGCTFYYPATTDYHAMLICDDKAGSIKSNMDLNSAISYIDSDWDCERGGPIIRDAYFANGASSSSFEPVVATERPIMDSRVVSYQSAGWDNRCEYRGIVSDAETLKSWFPNDYDEQKGECNYFAIFNTTSSTGSGYLVLAQDKVLYSLLPNPDFNEACMSTADIFYETMLVCDDKANTLRNNINLNGSYVVPDWDCMKWESTPEKGFFNM